MATTISVVIGRGFSHDAGMAAGGLRDTRIGDDSDLEDRANKTYPNSLVVVIPLKLGAARERVEKEV